MCCCQHIFGVNQDTSTRADGQLSVLCQNGRKSSMLKPYHHHGNAATASVHFNARSLANQALRCFRAKLYFKWHSTNFGIYELMMVYLMRWKTVWVPLAMALRKTLAAQSRTEHSGGGLRRGHAGFSRCGDSKQLPLTCRCFRAFVSMTVALCLACCLVLGRQALVRPRSPYLASFWHSHLLGYVVIARHCLVRTHCSD